MSGPNDLDFVEERDLEGMTLRDLDREHGLSTLMAAIHVLTQSGPTDLRHFATALRARANDAGQLASERRLCRTIGNLSRKESRG